jgi:hypothetical protein
VKVINHTLMTYAAVTWERSAPNKKIFILVGKSFEKGKVHCNNNFKSHRLFEIKFGQRKMWEQSENYFCSFLREKTLTQIKKRLILNVTGLFPSY